ncbi:hypothetical protein SKAU_G00396350 [Synaphobranchus kaupii]|uniref:EF-hand domain-containing protein n=1 Tax=Synaphobranchus kaupii TaxID=118154 RepID=A0A9Q1ECK0_SYNKA|nr:hypothetical protein SKAU_G00396350 [Synaphobranchus kaupii]
MDKTSTAAGPIYRTLSSKQQTGFPVSVNMAQLEGGPGAIELGLACIVGCFDKHARGDGDAASLTTKEFQSLIKDGFPNVLKGECAEKIMKTLDLDESGTVDFKEFMNLIGSLAIMLHQALSEISQKSK